MRFEALGIEGAVRVELEMQSDERGWFARSFCSDEFSTAGLSPTVAQSNVSVNARRGTLRGMHLQVGSHAEEKLIRCTRGRAYDVLVDLRPDSRTFLQWVGLTLSPHDGVSVYAPKGVAHGFLTLEDDTELHYQMSAPYAPTFARGVRWDDPVFGIVWPRPVHVISERDATLPDFDGLLE